MQHMQMMQRWGLSTSYDTNDDDDPNSSDDNLHTIQEADNSVPINNKPI